MQNFPSKNTSVGIRSTSDYSGFGVQLDGRTANLSDYRYGFQGQEKDDEVKGEGYSVNYKYRMHDPRVGRFFAVDPLIAQYPHYSSYSFSGNKVIAWAELEGKEEILVIREQVSASEYKLTYIWDVTAEKRGENGQIQYYDVSSGTLGLMRSTNLEERKNTSILTYLNIPLTHKSEGSTVNSYKTEQMGLKRTDNKGNLVPYLQSHRDAKGANVGESQRIFVDDVLISGITSTNYTMPQFSNATNAQRLNMTQPSNVLKTDLDALAKSYLNGNAIDIKVQITTNRSPSTLDIVQSNTMRQNAVVDYLISKGVDRASITTLPFQYNQSTWDSQITYDERKPSSGATSKP